MYVHIQRDYDGKGEQPIYIALKGDVFDVSSAKEFYGEGSG
jgi:predicted heme/steroid binding protein